MPFARRSTASAAAPADAASPGSVAPAAAWASGAVPARAGGRAARRLALRRFANAKVIFCCESASATLARSGRPSGEKNSSVSSSESIIPSNWKEPQTKRTAGGANCGCGCADPRRPPDRPDPPAAPVGLAG